ncbi:hypothetical protein SAMN06298211_10148 [Prevotellaceae bacterium MN60]|nr:hypothetical protein SAMN06298211_10148 [Prevotellaceae bacterium MN60]
MKTMKNFLSMAALALMGAMMTGCSSDDNFDYPQQPENKSKVVTLTTTVGFDASADTRALTSTGVKTFAVGDQIAVIYKNTSDQTVTATSTALTTGDITNEGKNANFTVTLTNPKASEAVRYIYPAAMLAATVATDAAVNADANVKYGALATQDGTLTNLASKLDLAIFDGSLTSEAALPASASMTNQLAILAITLKDNAATPSEITGGITSLTIGDGTNTYTVSRSAAAGPIYVAIRPTTSANIKIYASDGSKYYNKNLTGKTYAADNGYSVSWKMPEALISNATTADYGMVACAAGHLHLAKTAVPSGCTAVGILGKVTATGKGLILALKDAATSPSWNTINGWTSVDTYAGTTLKQLPAGALGSLTSYTTLGSTAVSDWCVAQKSDYEAIFINLGSAKHDSDGYTYDDYVNAYITTGVGGTAISDVCWSATEYDGSVGWAFSSYYWNRSGKTSLRSLRPVLGF